MDYPYKVGSYSRKVTTSSADAQGWFDRGLNWCFGYHHEEAVACFAKTLEADPNCGIAHWGIAYAVGPNYNFPWELQDPAGKAAALARAYDFDARRPCLGRSRYRGGTHADRGAAGALPAARSHRRPASVERCLC